MSEEVASLAAALSDPSERRIGPRRFLKGTLCGQHVVVVESRWGKVAAATTATHLIDAFMVDAILFTGVAGAVDPSLRVGDIVIARDLYQHDMDASPLFAPMEIPLLGAKALRADEDLSSWMLAASIRFLAEELTKAVDPETRAMFHLDSPRAVMGDVATGDRFFASAEAVASLRRQIPTAACVEMEGAAVAQVCREHGVPFAVMRTISDNADHTAGQAFPRFLSRVAGAYTLGVVSRFLVG